MINKGLLLKWFLALLLVSGAVATVVNSTNVVNSTEPKTFDEIIHDPLPVAPKIVDQSVTGICSAQIIWADYALDEDSIYLYRRVVGGNFTAVQVQGKHTGESGYFNDGPLPMGEYEYRVNFNNEYGQTHSNISEPVVIDQEVCGNVPLLIKPLNPVITILYSLESVQGTQGPSCGVRIYFEDHSIDEDGIRIYRSSAADPAKVVIADLPPHDGPTSSYDDIPLPAGIYTYQVSVYNSNGESFSKLSGKITLGTCFSSTATSVVITSSPTLVSTVTPTNVAQAQACIWKASVNVFIRKGPGASLYPEITAVESGTELPVVGQSEDGQFWAVELRPGLIGYVPNSEKFGLVTGDCKNVPTLQDPAPPPTPVPTITPQCSDGIDNDRDGRIDGLDRECTGPNDTSER